MDEKCEPILIYATFGDRENASAVARGIIEMKLGACVNLVDEVTSYFEWEGELCQERELVMLVKTLRRVEGEVISYISDNHNYDEPAILTLPVNGGAAGYLAWAAGQVRSKP